MNAPHSHSRQGFTLIELLIVVVIIGILAAIAIPKFSAVREQAYRASMMADLKNLAHFQELYHNDNHSYSDVPADLGTESSVGVDITITTATGTGWAATATHEGTGPTNTCGVFHGNAPVGAGNPAVDEGVIACSF